MNRNRLIPVLAGFVVGAMVGWAVHGRVNGHTHTNPFTVTFEPGHEIRIAQPGLSGNDWRLVPYAVNNGEHRNKVGESPDDPKQIWLVTYDEIGRAHV